MGQNFLGVGGFIPKKWDDKEQTACYKSRLVA